LEEFNSQFYDTMEREVFWKLGLKEMADYTGLLNYITRGGL
jgi:hypothetical protein